MLSTWRRERTLDYRGVNAVAESFFATLEFELVMTHDWHTREEARRAIFRYIETWYSRKRRHSTLGYVSPAEYEVQLLKAAYFLSNTRPLFRGKSNPAL
jgi:transposase InsO family protein